MEILQSRSPTSATALSARPWPRRASFARPRTAWPGPPSASSAAWGLRRACAGPPRPRGLARRSGPRPVAPPFLWCPPLFPRVPSPPTEQVRPRLYVRGAGRAIASAAAWRSLPGPPAAFTRLRRRDARCVPGTTGRSIAARRGRPAPPPGTFEPPRGYPWAACSRTRPAGCRSAFSNTRRAASPLSSPPSPS